MYNSSYSQASFGLAAKKMHKSKGKSCGYYMKIVFFFSSLIQSLIIASLVLFLVYGQPEHTIEEKRLQELDQSVGKLTMENFLLREKEKNLTKVLNITLTAKLNNDKLVSDLRRLANTSSMTIRNMQTTMSRCEMEKRMATPRACPPTYCSDPTENNKRLQSMLQQSDEMLKLVKANFTQTVAIMRSELDASNKGKDEFHLKAIELRRDKTLLEEELLLYQKKCKEDFVDSLRGIPNVTKEFLKRIDDFFTRYLSFQITCDKQRNQLENIHENCSSLSREVENKLQNYLNIVGDQVTKINGENARYVIENKRLREDAQWCNQNRSAMIRDHRRTLEQFQLKNDHESEKLLLANRKVTGDNEMKDKLLSVKENKIQMLTSTIETLNNSLASCKRTNPFMSSNTGGTGLGSTGSSKPNMPWPGTGSSGSAFPSFPGPGSSSRWGSTGSGVTGPLNTPLGGTGTLSSTGLGGPGLSRTQTGTSSFGGAGLGLTGLGSAGSSSASTGNTGTGLTALSSAGSSSGLIRPVTGGTSFTSLGSNPSGFGARTAVGGSESQPISQAQINLHLKELLRFSLPN